MEFRGKFTCKDCGKIYDWICQFSEPLDGPLPSTYDTKNYDRFIVLKERKTNIKNQYLLHGYCRCGRPVAFEYRIDTKEVMP